MVKFEKEIVRDPIEDFQTVKIPNEAREGPIVKLINAIIEHNRDDSYHQGDPKEGHWSTSSGCSTRSYLNYAHKLDPDKEPIPNTPDSERTFTHGDLIHEWLQELLVDALGREHVAIEENIEDSLTEEYGAYGHADIVIRGVDSPEKINDALPDGINLSIPEDIKGFPNPFVIDIKTSSEFKYYSFADDGHARSIPKSSNLKQLMGYMHHIGAQHGALLYYSKRNDHLEEYWAEFDQQLFEEGKRHIVNVLEHVNSGTVPKKDADSYMCDPEYCKYRREGICSGVDGAPDYKGTGDRLEEFNYSEPPWD